MKKISSISLELYCGYFALLHASLRLSSSWGSLDLSNFFTKYRGFSKILVRTNFFEKFFYQNILNNFVLFKLSYILLPLTIESCSPNEQIHPAATRLAPYRFLESGRPDQVSAGAHFSLASITELDGCSLLSKMARSFGAKIRIFVKTKTQKLILRIFQAMIHTCTFTHLVVPIRWPLSPISRKNVDVSKKLNGDKFSK